MKTLQLLIITACCFIGQLLWANTVDLPPFNKIRIMDNSKVELKIGTPQTVIIENENSSGIRLNVENNTLYIQGKSSRLSITIPELQGLYIMGVGSLECEDTIRTQSLEINIAGNGKAELVIDAAEMETKISGMGKLELDGYAGRASYAISGSGKVDGIDLQVKKATANISGVGKIHNDVIQELDLSISGSGSFYYKSKPPVVNARISGIGKYGVDPERGERDTTTMNIGSNRFVVVGGDDDDRNFAFFWDRDTANSKPEKARSHWGGMDIGFNQLMVGGKFKTTLPDQYDYLELNSGKSINVNLNFFYHDFEIYKRYVLFTTGIGLTLNNYRFSSDLTLRPDTNRMVAGADFNSRGEEINYRKNKMAVNYITLPVLFYFNTHEHLKKSFHLGAGVLVSYKYNSHLKLVWNEDGDKEKDKRRDEYNINPFRYDATLRLGYKYYTLYASYALNDMFRESRGAPRLRPFQIGINIFGW